MPNLFIMVGAPGSGKSYYLSKVANDKCKIVSRDKVRFSMIKDEDEYFSKEKKVFSEYAHQIQMGLDEGYDVYADATQLNGVSRFKLMSALDLKGVDIIPIVMRTPLDICLERNSHREGRARVPDHALINMYNSMTDPIHDEDNMDYKYLYVVYIGEDK